MIVQKSGDGNYYVYRRYLYRNTKLKNWFLIKWGPRKSRGLLSVRTITFPKKLVGKKICLRIEVLE